MFVFVDYYYLSHLFTGKYLFWNLFCVRIVAKSLSLNAKKKCLFSRKFVRWIPSFFFFAWNVDVLKMHTNLFILLYYFFSFGLSLKMCLIFIFRWCNLKIAFNEWMSRFFISLNSCYDDFNFFVKFHLNFCRIFYFIFCFVYFYVLKCNFVMNRIFVVICFFFLY